MLEISLNVLPRRVSSFDAVEQCYQDQLRFVTARLNEEVSVLIRCEKQIIPFLQSILKRRLATDGKSIAIIDGRDDQQGQSGTRLSRIVSQLRELVNNTETNKVFFLPYLDIITSTLPGGLTMEAREIMTIIHENPMLNLVAFEDPDFSLPELIAQAFPARCEMLGIPRNRIASLITENEARKFAVDHINLMGIYKFVSGLNPVRFREIMGIFSRKADYDPSIAEMLPGYMKELREYTACGGVSLSDIELERDIAGYGKVKTKIRENVLNLLQKTAAMNDEVEIRKIESIIPRGLIFHGPPGTGKTLFAKGIAEALNAAIYIVSGPELKSKWVGEGEANIRRLFARARSTAPSVIVFDEIDSIAAARTGGASDGASQAAHSMVNQLLTEMDGFRKEQMVLIIGTTNFVESLDPAFLRPGRFEYQIEIPYPEWEDRKAILSLYNQKFETGLSNEQVEKLAGWTGRRTDLGTPYTGDHLNALIKDLRRYMINNKAEADEETLKAWLAGMIEEANLSDEEERVVAFHEAGHALAFFLFDRQSEITRITLESGGTDSLGFVESINRKPNYFYTESHLKGEIAISLGGYAAEKVMFGEVSTGACQDLRKATAVATDMASLYGMAGTPREFAGRGGAPDPYFLPTLSPHIDRILNEVYVQIRTFLQENSHCLKRLVEELQKQRTLNLEAIEKILETEKLLK
ncbi:MAG: cell division protease FtsH [Clostridiales bacterium]|jgi:cell division protease FtsH|nr:cell division protease FtsH [Clostridiales bacterium]MDN5283085.1 cell division protease FtsH [Candidatus Ozemobacter sp.]